MEPEKKKRVHSRGGCFNCKRRRAKCDEMKPTCSRCVKSKKECVYGKTYKFASSRAFTVKTSNLMEPEMTNVNFENECIIINEKCGENYNTISEKKVIVDPFVDNPPFILQNSAQDLPPFTDVASNYQPDNIQIPNYNQHDLENSLVDGASNLISELNDFFATFDIDKMEVNSKGELQFPDGPITFQDPTSSPSTHHKKSSSRSPLMMTEDNRYINTINVTLNDYKDNISDGTTELDSSPVTILPYKSSTNVIRSVGLKAYPCPEITRTEDFNFDYIKVLDSTVTDGSEMSLANYFNLNIHSSQYKYLKIFFTHIHLNLLPFSTSYINNAYINTFLCQSRNSLHLLYAILAIAAKYEAYQVEQKLRELNIDGEDFNDFINAPDYFDQPLSSLQTLILENKARFRYHMKFRAFYLSSCLKSLSTILLSKEKTLNNIESLLLTILILASDFSGLKGSQWREHLNAARDLLVNYVKWGQEKRECSIELVIVWLWFYAMEVLAALSSPNGGTIHTFEELDTFLPVLLTSTEKSSVSLAMAEFGFSIKCGKLNDTRYFNMYLGYDECMIEVFNDLVFGFECIRTKISSGEGQLDITDMTRLKSVISGYDKINENSDKVHLEASFIMKLVVKIQKAREFEYITNQWPYFIPHNHILHPHNAFKTSGLEVIPSNYIKTTNGDFYSWIDLSQQLFADATLLRLVVGKSMSVNSPFVRDVVSRMLGGLTSLVSWRSKHNMKSSQYITDLKLVQRYGVGLYIQTMTIEGWPTIDYGEFLNYNIDRRLVMVQWPLYICGLCCLTPEEKIVVECCFDGLIKFGVGSGELSLKKLQRVWNLERTAGAKDIDLFGDRLENDQDDEFVDSVPFA